MKSQKKKKVLYLSFYFYYLCLHQEWVNEPNHTKFCRGVWYTDYLFRNIEPYIQQVPYLCNGKRVWFLARLPKTLRSGYYFMDDRNFIRHRYSTDISVYNEESEKFVKSKVKVWHELNIESIFRGLGKDNKLKEKSEMKRWCFVWYTIPFLLWEETQDETLRTPYMIDKYEIYGNLMEHIDLDSDYFDKEENVNDFLSDGDNGYLMAWVFYWSKTSSAVKHLYGAYALCCYYGLWDIEFYIFSLPLVIYFGEIILMDLFLTYTLSTDRALGALGSYFGKSTRNLYEYSTPEMDSGTYEHMKDCTTHITGKNGPERYLWTYGSNIHWIKDKRLLGFRDDIDDSAEIREQIYVYRTHSNYFHFQDEIPAYPNKYTFGSLYFRFGHEVECYGKDKYLDHNVKLYNYDFTNRYMFEDIEGLELRYWGIQKR